MSSEYRKKYYQEHKEQESQNHRRYYQAHREEILQQRKEYRERNPEARKKYYLEHREQELAIVKRWKETHREQVRETWKRWAKNNPEKTKARNFVNNHNLPLGLKCVFCGSTENLEHGHLDYDYPEIYLTVCGRCNKWMDKPIGVK